MPWWRKQSAMKVSHKASVRSEPASTICTDGAKCPAGGQWYNITELFKVLLSGLAITNVNIKVPDL